MVTLVLLATQALATDVVDNAIADNAVTPPADLSVTADETQHQDAAADAAARRKQIMHQNIQQMFNRHSRSRGVPCAKTRLSSDIFAVPCRASGQRINEDKTFMCATPERSHDGAEMHRCLPVERLCDHSTDCPGEPILATSFSALILIDYVTAGEDENYFICMFYKAVSACPSFTRVGSATTWLLDYVVCSM